MSKFKRAIPVANGYMKTQPFWDGARQKILMVQKCNETGQHQWPPRPVSIYTGGTDLTWVPASGKAILYSWTITHSAWPGHEERGPYICAYVQLDEGVRMLSNLIECEPADLQVGMPLELTWDELDEDVFYPAFRPAAQLESAK